MKKRRPDDMDRSVNIYTDDKKFIKIDIADGLYTFEIGNEITSDLSEAVSIMIRKIDFDDPIWDLDVKNFEIENIKPDKCLFWLSGGYSEWRTLEHYKTPWFDCYHEYENKFGGIVLNILKRSKKLKDIRNKMLKHLSLPILYDFALSKNLVK